MKNPLAKRSLGQNFLVDERVVGKIVSAIDLSPDDTVFEIGPGRGALTDKLVDSGAHVVAIELDRKLVPILRDKYANKTNFHIVEEDVLGVEFGPLTKANPQSAVRDPRSARLVANLPYNISTAILQRLAEQRDLFSSLVLMFQKEVVDRITAKPGNADRGFLTVTVEAAFSIEKLFDVPPTAFQPVPKVWSSVVRLTPKLKDIADETHFRQLVSEAFRQKRKTILNNLKEKYPNASVALESSDIDPKRRAEALSLSEWVALHEALRQK